MQKVNLPPQVKIWQIEDIEDNKDLNIDEYINIVYKDIFSRFLISKGIGVEWEGCHSGYGVLNGNEEIKGNYVYSWLLDLIKHYGLHQK